jgi:hypothetical protein
MRPNGSLNLIILNPLNGELRSQLLFGVYLTNAEWISESFVFITIPSYWHLRKAEFEFQVGNGNTQW